MHYANSSIRTVLVGVVLFLGMSAASGQSKDINFPTPVRSDKIEAVITPRAIGDSRLTTFYFTFDGAQGDVFINTRSTNFNGDIDIFVAGSLRPLAKMVFYSDTTEFETGRVIYFRKPEKLILRIEGRTPNDNEAKIDIRFAGSFVASNEKDAPDDIKLTARPTDDRVAQRPDPEVPATRPIVKPDVKPAATPKRSEQTKPQVVVSDNTATKSTAKPPVDPKKPEIKKEPVRSVAKPAPAASSVPKTDPMANVRLVVTFKDGTVIDRPMSEVIRFSIENSVLTIVAKNGLIGRYQMINVTNVIVQ